MLCDPFLSVITFIQFANHEVAEKDRSLYVRTHTYIYLMVASLIIYIYTYVKYLVSYRYSSYFGTKRLADFRFPMM